MFHETPFRYLLNEIVPTECSKRMAPMERSTLGVMVEQIFLARDISAFVDESFDWTGIREEIDELLRSRCACTMRRSRAHNS
jgi:hypothetical protein